MDGLLSILKFFCRSTLVLPKLPSTISKRFKFNSFISPSKINIDSLLLLLAITEFSLFSILKFFGAEKLIFKGTCKNLFLITRYILS